MYNNFHETSIDKNIGEILDELVCEFNSQYKFKSVKEFCKTYSKKNISEINWIDLCKDAHDCKKYKFCLGFLTKILEKNLYFGQYSSELYDNLKKYKDILNREISDLLPKIFCYEKIEILKIIENYIENGHYLFVLIEGNNNFIKEILQSFLKCNDRKLLRCVSKEKLLCFEESLGSFRNINTYKDFNGNTFFTQINFYKNKYKSDLQNADKSIKLIVSFYRWLCNEYNEFDFFENSLNMTTAILFKTSLVQTIKDDYKFILYNPHGNIPKEDKICFILNGFENQSTKITNSTTFLVDLSSIDNKYYKDLIKTYLIKNNILTIGMSPLLYIIEGLKFLLELKNQDIYPNKNLKYLTNQESVLIKNFIINTQLKPSTINNKIGALRRFFNWTKDNYFLEFDDLFFEYLRQYEEPTINKAIAIPENELVLLNDYFFNKSKQNLKYKLIYIIIHLAIQTEFRMSQICHLKVDCIEPSIKPNQYIIKSNSKTSHGKIESFVITDLTYKLLKYAIEITASIRDNCNIETLKDYIFVYNGNLNSTVLINTNVVSKTIEIACKELKFKNVYRSSNLRDTHMTKALEYNLRHNKSDISLNLLSGHKHIDTTKNNYIEIELEKMLEATYGIVIGEEYIETDSKIVEKIPNNLKGEEYDVENGCGKCTAESCVITSSLPCLACKHFITTPQHEIFFKKAIENINKLIEKTTNNHDKEDLITIKQLYILYLKSIYKYQEVMYD